jgi:DNA-binding transcriptional ArsR family regulator
LSTVSKKLDRTDRPPGGPDRRPAFDLKLDIWPAADLLMSVLAVVDKPAQRTLEARHDWRDRAVRLGETFLSSLDQYGRETWINLIGLLADEPAARTGPGFVEVARGLDPIELLRHLSGYYRRVYRRETPAAVMDAALHGDPAARREFRRTSFPSIGYLRDTLRHLLSAEPDEIQAEFVELVERGQAEVHGPCEADVTALAERSLAAFRAATDGLAPEQVVERAAPGLTFVPEAGQTSVVLVPSVAIRPLWAVTDHRAANIFVFSAPPDADEPVRPPVRLVALGKAIGDETRLRILRELATRPATPPDLADRMGIPRTSLLHHLRILRDADLITVRVNDADYHQYHVRDEHFGEIERLLGEYLG